MNPNTKYSAVRRWYPTILLVCLATPVLLYGYYHLITAYWLPVLRDPRFFEDFGYFYIMGQRAISEPSELYASIGQIGTWVVTLNERVFHMYSPPSALMFSLLTVIQIHHAYVFMTIALAFSCIASVFLFIETVEPGLSRQQPFLLALCVFIALSVAPTFHDLYEGNVNAFVLFLCVLYCWLLIKERYVLSGVVLAFGFWLKLYPVILLVLLIGRSGWLKASLSFGLVILVSFVLSLTWIPFNAYNYFYLTVLPAYSEQTTLHIFNQSLPAALMRIQLGPEAYLSWDNVLTASWVRTTTYGLAAIMGLTSIYIVLSKPKLGTVAGECILMAMIPLITPVGWGYTFVLVVPAMLFCLIHGLKSSVTMQALTAAAILAFLIPAYSAPFGIVDHFMLRELFMNRYSIATVILVSQTIWIIGQQERGPLRLPRRCGGANEGHA